MTALSGTVLGGAVIGASAGLTNGLISGYGFARLGGSSVGQALLSGLKKGAIDFACGAIIGGATQGISNVYHGRNFWTGKAIAPVPQTSNSASSAASQSAEMTLEEYNAKCTDNPKNLPELKKGDIVYRVYGGDAKFDGRSWTSVNPNEMNINDYINGAGLPNNNTAEYLIKARVLSTSNVIQSRYAIPLHGHCGGLPEYLINNPFGTWSGYNSTSSLEPIGIFRLK